MYTMHAFVATQPSSTQRSWTRTVGWHLPNRRTEFGWPIMACRSLHYNMCYLSEQLVICSLAVTSRHCFSSLGGDVSMASVHIWFELCRLRAGLTSYHPRRHLQLLYRFVYSVGCPSVRSFGSSRSLIYEYLFKCGLIGTFWIINTLMLAGEVHIGTTLHVFSFALGCRARQEVLQCFYVVIWYVWLDLVMCTSLLCLVFSKKG